MIPKISQFQATPHITEFCYEWPENGVTRALHLAVSTSELHRSPRVMAEVLRQLSDSIKETIPSNEWKSVEALETSSPLSDTSEPTNGPTAPAVDERKAIL